MTEYPSPPADVVSKEASSPQPDVIMRIKEIKQLEEKKNTTGHSYNLNPQIFEKKEQLTQDIVMLLEKVRDLSPEEKLNLVSDLSPSENSTHVLFRPSTQARVIYPS